VDPYQEASWTVRRHFRAGEYEQALPAAQRLWDEFPAERHFSCWMLASAQYLTNDFAGALATIDHANDQDLLWRIWMFDRPHVFERLRDAPEFRAAMDRARTRIAALNLRPGLTLAEPAQPSSGLVLGFHGATSTPQTIIDHWRPATAAGWTIAAVHSTQPATASSQCWDNPEIVCRDVEAVLTDLPPHQRLILAGFSQGAATALDVLASGVLGRASRVIGVGPGFPGRGAPALPSPPVDIRIIVGADDPYAEPTLVVLDEYRTQGHSVTVEVIPGLGHAYPDDFAARLPALLAPD
jgi:dienelactone hydrolase